ncbi:hypothetical protein DVR12_17200 [Chitinophaga silvatica]|uniref:Uncharacterized protein n=1 Tax=Chitinophaga silvatica TaxID=2282649 RepID=A0A3E1Y7Q4_9BACT|nr:hypothetical protein [Chitinophaga silvatica]RFS21076.1 hypothetical protein DVR12_17200 [Chitinophaga silvatica]
MTQPLALLSVAILKAMLESGFTLFVRQSYPAGRTFADANIREVFLITPYTNIGEANMHFQHIRFDNRKYIYQTHHPEEVEKLYVAAEQPAGYKIYAAVIQEPIDQILHMLQPKIKAYILRRTKWGQEGLDNVKTGFILHYGDLCVTLQYLHEEIKVPLSEIDKY